MRVCEAPAQAQAHLPGASQAPPPTHTHTPCKTPWVPPQGPRSPWACCSPPPWGFCRLFPPYWLPKRLQTLPYPPSPIAYLSFESLDFTVGKKVCSWTVLKWPTLLEHGHAAQRWNNPFCFLKCGPQGTVESSGTFPQHCADYL